MSSYDLAEIRATKFSHRDHEADATAIANTVDAGLAVTDRTFESPFDRSHPIHQIGMQQYANFRVQAEQTGNDSLPWADVEHGFIVVSSGILKCLYAYARCLRETPETQHDKEQLKAALVNPRTITFFIKISSMSDIENREYEVLFNFRTGHSTEDLAEFNFDLAEGRFVPDAELEVEAEEEAACRRYELIKKGIDGSEFGYCPATKFIPLFWRLTVDACDVEGMLEDAYLIPDTCEQPSDRTY